MNVFEDEDRLLNLLGLALLLLLAFGVIALAISAQSV